MEGERGEEEGVEVKEGRGGGARSEGGMQKDKGAE